MIPPNMILSRALVHRPAGRFPKRLRRPVRKTVRSIEADRKWQCADCGMGPCRMVTDYREGGFVSITTYQCDCGRRQWNEGDYLEYIRIYKNL